MAKKILVAEDDPAILVNLADLLTREGYEVACASNGAQALEAYGRQRPDLIILDVTMPEKSGLDVCREIRARDPEVVIYMLTARAGEIDKVLGLEIGADDYIVKPFGVSELLARIRVAFRDRRLPGTKFDDTPFAFGKVKINPRALTGSKSGTEFSLTKREVNILQLFMKHDGEVIDRAVIFDEVWGAQYFGTTRTLDQHIALLRKKIEDDPARPRHILTAHGSGYRFLSKPK